MGWLFLATQAENESVRRRPLILPQDIQRLSNDKLLVRRGHLSLSKLNRIVWHRAPWFSRMRTSPPEIAPTVELDCRPAQTVQGLLCRLSRS